MGNPSTQGPNPKPKGWTRKMRSRGETATKLGPVIIGLKEPSFWCFCSTCFYMIRFYFSDLISKNGSWTKKNPESYLGKFAKRFTKGSTPRHLALVLWCHDASRATLGALANSWVHQPLGDQIRSLCFKAAKLMVPKSCNLQIKSKWNGKKSKNVSLKTKAPRKSVLDSFFM